MPSSRTRVQRRVAAARAEREEAEAISVPLISPGFIIPGPKAKKYAAELNRLASTYGSDNLDPKIIVDEARLDDSPLHDYFDWNDTSAAEKHRLSQARSLIRTIRVTYLNDPSPTQLKRAVVSVVRDDGERKLTGIHTALANEEHKRQLIQREMNIIRGCRDRLRSYDELSEALPQLNAFLAQAEVAVAPPPARPRRRRRAS